MTCKNCNGTRRALYFSEQSMTHEIRECHLCRDRKPLTDLADRCRDFKDNHDMGYSADDLHAFVLAEIDRAGCVGRQGQTNE
jgi:hypothetical protein